MVSALVLTEAPVEAAPRPLLVRALSCWLRAAEFVAVLAAAEAAATGAVPAARLELGSPVSDLIPVLPGAGPPVPEPVVLAVPALEEPTANAPTAAALACVPLRAPPEVLTQTCFSVS